MTQFPLAFPILLSNGPQVCCSSCPVLSCRSLRIGVSPPGTAASFATYLPTSYKMASLRWSLITVASAAVPGITDDF